MHHHTSNLLPHDSSASTRHKGKEITKPITPQSESVSEEDSDPEQARRDKDMKKNLALLAKYFKKLYKPTNNNLRTSSNSRNKTEDTTKHQCIKNDNQSGHYWESKVHEQLQGLGNSRQSGKLAYKMDTVFKLPRDLDTIQGITGSQSGLKTIERVSQIEEDDVQTS
ncbi:hypothetical protein Tco_0323619 [Tanacetum coccineum]